MQRKTSMHLLAIEGLKKSYGERVLFQDISFGIETGDKIGIIGINGTGKSTLLKVIAQKEVADEGKILKASGMHIEYLDQDPEFDENATVLTEVFRSDSPAIEVVRDYELALMETKEEPNNETAQKRLIQLTAKMDELDAWQIESDAKIVLTKLKIVDFNKPIKSLSGGQKKRVALARVLISRSDLLILDEPTNHIDSETIAWLEDYLAKRNGALLMITHDRYFLDRVTNRIIELDKGRLFSYQGNYTLFLEQKAAREEREEASERKRQNILRRELAWLKRGAKARTTKQKARIDRYHTLNNEEAIVKDQDIEINVGVSRLGRKIIELNSIGFSYEEQPIIEDFSYTLLRDDRIGIVGKNGSGKTTLLNIIAGELLPSSGTIDVGQTVKIGYFSQDITDMDERLRAIEYIKEEAHYITTKDGTTISAKELMENFLFPGHLQWTPIAKLSGGERRRLFLLRVLMGAPNVLLLDEPANDLDINTLSILEDYLENFQGAVICVSHDRYFLDRVIDKVFAFEGTGKIAQYIGGYSEYADNLEQVEESKIVPENKTIKPIESKPIKEQKVKLTFKEQREYQDIEGVIAEVEGELKAIEAQINGAGSNFELLNDLTKRKENLDDRLLELVERWGYLSEIAEAAK